MRTSSLSSSIAGRPSPGQPYTQNACLYVPLRCRRRGTRKDCPGRRPSRWARIASCPSNHCRTTGTWCCAGLVSVARLVHRSLLARPNAPSAARRARPWTNRPCPMVWRSSAWCPADVYVCEQMSRLMYTGRQVAKPQNKRKSFGKRFSIVFRGYWVRIGYGIRGGRCQQGMTKTKNALVTQVPRCTGRVNENAAQPAPYGRKATDLQTDHGCTVSFVQSPFTLSAYSSEIPFSVTQMCQNIDEVFPFQKKQIVHVLF